MLCLLYFRLSLSKNGIISSHIYAAGQRNFHNTPVLCAEPLKKKRKLDPAVVKQREDRRRKKLEKQIRRLEKNARQLKPVEELDVPLNLLDELDIRARKIAPLSEEEQERRALLIKKWSNYRNQENLKDYKTLDKLVNSQDKALQELRLVSEELYQKAIQTDMLMIPITIKGPMQTAPVKNYEFVDGDYHDISKKYDGE